MKGTVKIGNIDVDMVANALTPVLYRKVFRRDFLKETQSKDADLTVFQELGYIMQAQAKETDTKTLINSLTYDGYYEWLEGFEAMDIMSSVNEIFKIYAAQDTTTSKAKKKG